MLTTESCKALLDEECIEYGKTFTLQCRINTLHIHTKGISVKLNESQKRFMICMFVNVNCKREIIKIVWHENHQKINDNNYHQLVYKTRLLLSHAGMPDDTLMTLHYYGVKLNDCFAQHADDDKPAVAGKDADTRPSVVRLRWLSWLFSGRN